MIQSTRWNELTQAMKFHVNLVSSSGSTAQFRFLNNAAPITLSPKEPDVCEMCGIYNGINVLTILSIITDL